MPRFLPTAFLTEKNRLSSDHPLIFLAELDYGAGVERVTNNPEPITFQGLLFSSVPFTIPEFSEPGLSDSVRLTIVIGNATRQISQLAEMHWRPVLSPKWTVTLWYIDATTPDVIPLNANVGTYEVLNVEIQEVSAVFELYEPSISTTRAQPSRTVTVNSGFPNARTRQL